MTEKDWINQFVLYLEQSGLPRRQAEKYREGGEFHEDAKRYIKDGVCPADACVKELLP
ncbi:MAG: hypothetical protein AB7Q76_04190 [Gammaproteobacteria bacterium]